ncbi:MAG: hypothetical protein Q7S34_00865 [bacterium]|nr:hypothetical protein [bacterium]
MIKKILKILFYLALFIVILFFLLSFGKNPSSISYGLTFSKTYSDYLGVPFKETYISILDDLKVRKLRLMAYWPQTEPSKNVFDFVDLDFQIEEAQKRKAEVILAIGRRLPRWPECHVPSWAKGELWQDQKKELFVYLEKVVERYKGYENIKYWQVENEPFLSVFAYENCGDLDKDFLKEEIALVKKLDPSRPVLLTDSGNLGLWKSAWQLGDVFGTSVYVYLWNPMVGEIKSIYWPSFYKVKKNLMSLIYGPKKSLLIELSLEPWLLEPIINAPIDIQISRMDVSKFDEVIGFAKKTGFDEQYLWGVEWWYFMKDKGHPEYLEKAGDIFSKN